jgi:hypothetical protein
MHTRFSSDDYVNRLAVSENILASFQVKNEEQGTELCYQMVKIKVEEIITNKRGTELKVTCNVFN